MNGYLLLALAIIGEVFAASMLKASNGFKKILPVLGMAVGYAIAFFGLALSLNTIPLGVAYAIWSGVGTALTALIGIILYKEGVSGKKLLGLGLIIAGVVLLNLS